MVPVRCFGTHHLQRQAHEPERDAASLRRDALCLPDEVNRPIISMSGPCAKMPNMTSRFDLVAERGRFEFSDQGSDKTRFHFLEFQPAKRVSLVGEPPTRIRVVSPPDRRRGC